jgi:uncharacterized membrane protein
VSTRGRARVLVLVLAALIAVYLTVLHYTAAVPLVCPAGGTGPINCGNVLTSPESVWWGVPVPAVGLVWAVVGIALTVGQSRGRAWAVAAVYWLWSLAGVVTVLWLVYAELALIGSICLWCSIFHLIIVGLFVEWVWSGSLRPLDDEPDAS